MTSAPGMHSDKSKARALALAMHAAFMVLLIFGVSWQKKPELPVVADLWSSLPPMAQPIVEVAPEPEPEPPPKPTPRVVPPPPAPKVAPTPVAPPDIALKKKIEKEKKAEPKVEPKKREDDKADKARKEAEARKAAERQEQVRQEKAQEAPKVAEAKAAEEKAAQERARVSRELAKYTNGIQSKVWARVALPPDLQGNPEAEFVVSLLPGGELLNVTMRKSSGNAAYDAVIERAIRQAQPFTVPSGDDFQRYFRQFPMTFRPQR
jgi:colicin import membrane protein